MSCILKTCFTPPVTREATGLGELLQSIHDARFPPSPLDGRVARVDFCRYVTTPIVVELVAAVLFVIEPVITLVRFADSVIHCRWDESLQNLINGVKSIAYFFLVAVLIPFIIVLGICCKETFIAPLNQIAPKEKEVHPLQREVENLLNQLEEADGLLANERRRAEAAEAQLGGERGKVMVLELAARKNLDAFQKEGRGFLTKLKEQEQAFEAQGGLVRDLYNKCYELEEKLKNTGDTLKIVTTNYVNLQKQFEEAVADETNRIRRTREQIEKEYDAVLAEIKNELTKYEEARNAVRINVNLSDDALSAKSPEELKKMLREMAGLIESLEMEVFNESQQQIVLKLKSNEMEDKEKRLASRVEELERQLAKKNDNKL